MYALIALVGAPIVVIFQMFGTWELYKASVVIGGAWSLISLVIYVILFELIPRVLNRIGGANG